MSTFVTLPAATTASGGFLTFPLPPGGRGVVTIKRVSDGALIAAFAATSAVASTVATITSVYPVQAPVGTEVTITGTNFGNAANLTAIRFGAGFITVSPSFASDTAIVCVVPSNADGGGIRVDTTNNGNSNQFPFAIGPVPNAAAYLWKNLTFANRAADLVTDNGSVWRTTSGDGQWGHSGLEVTYSLAANQSGSTRMRFTGPESRGVAVGLHSVNTRVAQPEMSYSMYVDEVTGFLLLAIRRPGSAAVVVVSSDYTPQIGQWLGLARTVSGTSSPVYVQTSPDGETWQVLSGYTLAGTDSYAGALFATADIHGNTATRLSLVGISSLPMDTTAAAGGGGLANLTFAVKMADFINDGTNVWGTTATDGTWGHGGKSDKYLIANADGGVLMRYASTAGAAGVLGLHTANVLVPHLQMRYSFYVEPTGTVSIFECAGASSGSNVLSTSTVAIVGNYYRINRAAGVVTVGTSADGVTWNTVFTYPAGTSAALYPMADVNANAAFHLQFPQGFGLTA